MRYFFTLLVALLFTTIGLSQNDICPGADVVVSVQNMSYTPADLVVEAGTTVGWVNYGGFHDVNGVNSSITGLPFDNPESFSFGSMNGTAEGVCLGNFTFTIPGFYDYDCTTYGHAASGMVASVTVTEVMVSGCTDPMASNYDPEATVDDGSCLSIFPQCEADFDFGDVGFGLSPDPLLGESLDAGVVDQEYYDVIHIIIPTTAADIDPSFPPDTTCRFSCSYGCLVY